MPPQTGQPVGYPALAHALAWGGIVTVIVGFALIYGAGGPRLERRGFAVAVVGAIVCFAALAVAP